MAGGEPYMIQRMNDGSGGSEETFASPHAKRRKFRSQSEQRYNVDYSAETQLNYEIFVSRWFFSHGNWSIRTQVSSYLSQLVPIFG